MMYWFKKIVRAILNLLPVFVFSLIFFNPTYALKHEYSGILYSGSYIPCGTYDSSTNTKSIIWNPERLDCAFSDGNSLSLKFEGDAYQSSYSSLSPKYSSTRLDARYNSSTNKCSYYDLLPIFVFDSSPSLGFYTSLHAPYSSSIISSEPTINCQKSDIQYTGNNFDFDSIPAGLLSCGRSNGAVCGGLWNTKEYINDQIMPYMFTSDGFYLKSKAIDSDGIHYSNTFSFNDMLNNYIPTFSELVIPLNTKDGYFTDSSNLYNGRQFEFDFHFEFDGSFSWHENIDTNGSFIHLHFDGINRLGSDDNFISRDYSCPANLVTLDGFTRLDISCIFTLDYDYLFISPRLEINGNGNYVWTTDKEWRFSDVFVVTDGDDTPGDSFNSNLTGGGTIPGDASNNITSGTPDWLSSLTSLFSFNFFNPFAPIFQLFTSSDSCASIPTLAGLIHSEETTVCPWFPASVRSIMTPVLGLSSMMLVFGFAVRWLGSSSGNMFEDSGGHDSGSYHFENKFRRKKK